MYRPLSGRLFAGKRALRLIVLRTVICSDSYLTWCVERGIGTLPIQPGRPMQNGHVESFHGRFRDERLSVHCFTSLWDARPKNAASRSRQQGAMIVISGCPATN